MKAWIAIGLLALAGCTSAPEAYEAKTRVYRDGYFARQVTYVPAGWNSKGREYETFCLYRQLLQSQVDGQWYCPPDNSIEMLKTQTSLAYSTHTSPYREQVIPMIGDVASGALIGTGLGVGLSNMQASRMTQSVSGGGFGPNYISTFNGGAGAIPGLPNGR